MCTNPLGRVGGQCGRHRPEHLARGGRALADRAPDRLEERARLAQPPPLQRPQRRLFARLFRLLPGRRGSPGAQRVHASRRDDPPLLVGRDGGRTADPGQDPRGAPDPAPLWMVLDCTPEGRGPDWYPKLEYACGPAQIQTRPERTTMRVMVIVKATKEFEAGGMPTAELMAEMGAFNQALIDAGVFVDAGGLKESRKGARVAFSGKERTVTKGPFRTSANLPRATGSGRSRTSTRRSTGSSAAPTRCRGLPRSRSARCSRWRTLAHWLRRRNRVVTYLRDQADAIR